MSQVLVKGPKRKLSNFVLPALLVQLPESRFAYSVASLSYSFSSWESLTRSGEQLLQYRTRSLARSSMPQLLPRYKRCCHTSAGGVGVVCLCEFIELTARVLLLTYTFIKLISKHGDLQTDKEAHKASEEAHGDATKGHLSQAQGHAKDAAKQAVGAGDAKKEQAKAGHKVKL